MTKHYVTFFSPGTFVAEDTTREIASWDVGTAKWMAMGITERHGARPYAFQFTTRERGPEDFDSKETGKSGMYFLGGRVDTQDDIARRADPKEEILLANMRCNGWDRVVTTTNGYRWTQPLHDGDTVLDA